MCGAIVTISPAVTVIIKVIQKAKQPEESQNKRLDDLEKKVERHEQLFDNDNKRLIELEKGNRVMQQSMLALLSHALNGDDVDSLKKAKDNLQNYLIDKENIL
jgi:hypothetical protein